MRSIRQQSSGHDSGCVCPQPIGQSRIELSSIEADKARHAPGFSVTTAKNLDGLNPSTQDDYEQDKENQNNSY